MNLDLNLTSNFPHLSSREMRECDSVAYAAFEHLGKGYRITRELQPDVIDCSTLVSQAHWTGAAIRMPFIAEMQRLDAGAANVSKSDLLPGDAIYAYQSRDASPGGRHNHVALFVGNDRSGIAWAIESREEVGVRLVELNQVRDDGGIRRFASEPFRTFPGGEWSEFARRVPKLGRLGCRLTAQYGKSRRHRGSDIYAEPNWVAVSPLSGTVISVFKMGVPSQSFIGIWSAEKEACSLIGPVRIAANIRVGAEVDRGQLLGGLGMASGSGRCNVIAWAPGAVRIHWELWGSARCRVSAADDLRCDWLPRRLARGREFRAQNALYELKRGNIGPCLLTE